MRKNAYGKKHKTTRAPSDAKTFHKSIQFSRNGLSKGIGQPEPLRYRKAWSRRITHSDRLVYNLTRTKKLIIACMEHYKT